jgi:hypothetical protein
VLITDFERDWKDGLHLAALLEAVTGIVNIIIVIVVVYFILLLFMYLCLYVQCCFCCDSILLF